MTATQNGPQLSGSGDEPPRDKKHDAQLAILIAIIFGGFAGILRRTMEAVSYYEAMATAGGVFIALVIMIFVVLTYIRS
ncbi:hypothetical protein ABZ691_32845 [Streptomyces sp. NPDC006854]|uniref:hypothetical protein n=1 Tax=Streptomyces sp. NPDC006854 TaxID=3155115 RepID=UPI0033CFAD81